LRGPYQPTLFDAHIRLQTPPENSAELRVRSQNLFLLTGAFKLAGEVSTRASFTMAKEVPQKMETPSKTPSAARCEEEDVSILAKPSPRFLEWKPLYQGHPPRINQNR